MQVVVDVGKGVSLAGVAGSAGGFHGYIGVFGQSQQVGEVGPGFGVGGRAAAAEVVHNQLDAGVALGDGAEGGQKGGASQGYRQAGLGGCRPQPIHRAIGGPGQHIRLLKGKAQAQHPRLLFPAVHQGAAFRLIQGEVAQHGQAVGVLGGGVHGQLAGVGIPARGMDDGGVHAGLVHFPQQVGYGKGSYLAVGRVGGQTGGPEVNLGVND